MCGESGFITDWKVSCQQTVVSSSGRFYTQMTHHETYKAPTLPQALEKVPMPWGKPGERGSPANLYGKPLNQLCEQRRYLWQVMAVGRMWFTTGGKTSLFIIRKLSVIVSRVWSRNSIFIKKFDNVLFSVINTINTCTCMFYKHSIQLNIAQLSFIACNCVNINQVSVSPLSFNF